MSSLRDDAWLAGFAAGEATFLLAPRNRGRLAPVLAITLRADDLEILERLKAEFGGAMCVKTPRGRDNPAATWTVARKRDLAGLVEYFDRFPLRAKKARDYAVWRRAVIVYCAHGSTSPELWPLREALMAGRKYARADEEIVVGITPCQLRSVS
jgi:hypothetical protein